MNKKTIFIFCLSASLFNLQSAENIKRDFISKHPELEKEFLALTGQIEQVLNSAEDNFPDGKPTPFYMIQAFIKASEVGPLEIREGNKIALKKQLKKFGCFTCKANTAKFCGECKAIMFCSTECQRIAWKDHHKKECPQIALMMKEHNF
ncbi:MAG: zinc finger MYND domain-containing protein [Saprospiraceae bacterium]|nr:zinc finger MYND domain-containing protein [Saprospiraceae bacterium]